MATPPRQHALLPRNQLRMQIAYTQVEPVLSEISRQEYLPRSALDGMNKNLRILVAEDNPADVILIREALNEHGLLYSLRLFEDGAEIAKFLENLNGAPGAGPPDLALLDLNLPKIQGHELLSMIRSHPVYSDLPVIIVTSSDSPEDRQKAAQLGASYYFRKPSTIDDFLLLGGIVKSFTDGA